MANGGIVVSSMIARACSLLVEVGDETILLTAYYDARLRVDAS
jgi:hypothetical protein